MRFGKVTTPILIHLHLNEATGSVSTEASHAIKTPDQNNAYVPDVLVGYCPTLEAGIESVITGYETFYMQRKRLGSPRKSHGWSPSLSNPSRRKKAPPRSSSGGDFNIPYTHSAFAYSSLMGGSDHHNPNQRILAHLCCACKVPLEPPHARERYCGRCEPRHKVYMHFMKVAEGWRVTFLEADLKTPLPRFFMFQDSVKVIDMAIRGGAGKVLADRQAIEHGISLGRGSAWLSLTAEQYGAINAEDRDVRSDPRDHPGSCRSHDNHDGCRYAHMDHSSLTKAMAVLIARGKFPDESS